MRTLRRTAALVVLAAALAGCRIDVPAEFAEAPDGYHRMPDGTLMANVAMETEYRDLSGNGVLVATHTRPDGTVVLGPPPDHANGDHGGHDHEVPDPADFPQGIVPARLVIPRLDLDAPVVAASMTADGIQGPPVAGDVAWLEQTRRPGEIGPALLGGVDQLAGTAGAYARLADLEPGDEFVILSLDDEALAFRVVDVRETPVAERNDLFLGGADVAQVRLVDWAIDDETTDLTVHAEVIDPDV